MSDSATMATRKVHEEYLQKLPFDVDNRELEDVRRGLLEEVADLVIRDDEGQIVWNAREYYDFIANRECAPDTVNPSLWRHQRLECVAGFFEVMDGIWQVRGYDISNLTLIRSNNGYIVVDPLNSPHTARAALELAFKHLPEKPITGVIITHTHGDHYGGIDGVVSPELSAQGKVPIVVPADFTLNTIIERIFVGRAMMRRVPYQFGQKLARGATGTVGSGLGISSARTKPNFVMPTMEINATGETLNIDGVDFVFQLTPETEAPAEFCFYLPGFKTLCMAELLNPHLHNLLPLRGAQARSAKQWAHYLQEAIALFGDKAEVLINTHHWPVWGRKNIVRFLKKQRDLYKFINDQTVRRINHGQTMNEIAEDLQLPPALFREWSSRNYYGHIKHNIKATYQRYLGWFDCNPANLDPLPPAESGRHYVEFMGGPEETLRKARESVAKGEYRWAASVLNHLVFGYPDNREARELLADVYDQLGYQSESATWRNCYLTGALELRQGPGPEDHGLRMSDTALLNMPTGYLLDYLASTLDPEKADGNTATVLLRFTDKNEEWTWTLENSALNAWAGALPDVQAEYSLNRATFDALARRNMTVAQAMEKGLIVETGKSGVLQEIFDCLEDVPNFNFGIVTP